MPRLIEESPNSWIFHHELPEGSDHSLDVALDQFHIGNLDEAANRLRKLLLVCPEHIDALHHLALIFSKSDLDLESYLCTREAVRFGLEAFPPKFSWLTSQLSWGYIQNRPFMRAYYALGLLILKSRSAAAAIEIFARLVAVNSNDNLGARYILMRCHLDLAEWQSAKSLSQRYSEDIGPDIAYSKVVALLQLGQDEEAMMALKSAVQHSPNIASELVKAKHPRPESRHQGYITSGGEDEAFDYWENNRLHWARNSKALMALKKLLKR